MKKNIVYVLFLTLGVVIGSAGTLIIKGPPHRGPERFHEKLSKEDREKIKSLFKEGRGDFKDSARKMEELGKDLREKLKDSKASKEELVVLFNSFSDKQQELMRKRFEMKLKIRDVLGAEKMEGLDVLGPIPGSRKDFGPRKGKPDFGRPEKRKFPPPPPEDGSHEEPL